MREKVFSRLQQLLNEFLKLKQAANIKDVPEISEKTDLMDDLGVDSIETMDLMGIIEKEFQIKADLKDIMSKRKVSDIVEYILELQKMKR